MSGRSKDQDLIDELAAWMQAPAAERAQTNGHAKSRPDTVSGLDLADEQVIEKCRAAKDAARFSGLFDYGDMSANNNNASDTDYALLGKLKFWTQDPDQLDRIMRLSALRRPKWDEGRGGRTWLRYSIDNALEDLGEVYQGGRERSRRAGSGESYRYLTPNRYGNGKVESEEAPAVSIAFAEMPEPDPPEEIWAGAIVRGWPALWYGGTGVTKSVGAMAVAQAIADEHTEVFLGRAVITAPVMYADWELNAQVQGRRAYQIARGRGRSAPPAAFRYMSTYGMPRRNRTGFTAAVLAECVKHKCEVCFIDSVGLALGGNPGDFEVIIEFFEEVIADFTAHDITPVLIDHQRRLAQGERNQSLGAYGSVWKENLARTQMQIELVSRDREAHTMTTRMRPKKTNFGELPEPIEVMTTFSKDTIELELVALDDSERAGEDTLSARDRVLAALRTVEEAGPDEITEICQTLKKSTITKTLSILRNEDPALIEDADSFEGRARKVSLTVTVPYRGKVTVRQDENLSDPGDPTTVAEFFANPPDWLLAQLETYEQDPQMHFRPLCAAVAAVVLGDGTRASEVQEEVERELARNP